MKFKVIIFLTTLTLIGRGWASGPTEAKFEDQSKWEELELHYPEGYAFFRAFRTTRGTIRAEINSDYLKLPMILKTFSEKDNEQDWASTCKKMRSEGKAENFSEVNLSFGFGPFEKDARLIINKTGETISWKQVENSPRILGLSASITPNHFRQSSAYHLGPGAYEKYIAAVENDLNEQLQGQNEELVLNLSTPALKVFACDLSRGLLEVSLKLQASFEPAKLQEYSWIQMHELEALFETLMKQESPSLSTSLFGAGIRLGMALEKRKLNLPLFKNERELKLLKAFFVAEDKKFESFKLSNGGFETLKEKHLKLKELVVPEKLEQLETITLRTESLRMAEGVIE